MAWFELQHNTQMGSWYDSMNYDVFGSTDDRGDSAVVVDTCYHISPTPYLLDRDLICANAVQPVVCVDSINEGTDITVSVFFIDPVHPPAPSTDVVEFSINCSTEAETFVVDAKTLNFFHVNGMGDGGSVTVSLSSDLGWSTAYFYDA